MDNRSGADPSERDNRRGFPSNDAEERAAAADRATALLAQETMKMDQLQKEADERKTVKIVSYHPYDGPEHIEVLREICSRGRTEADAAGLAQSSLARPEQSTLHPYQSTFAPGSERERR